MTVTTENPTDNTADQESITAPPEEVTVPPAETAPPVTPVSTSPEKVVSLPTSAFARIKSEEREKSRKAQLRGFDKQARERGFASHEDMMSKVTASTSTAPKTTGTPPAATPETTPITSERPVHNRAMQKLQQENQRLLEDKRRSNRARAGEERSRKAAERQLAASEADAVMRMSATRHGVGDVDYGLHKLKAHLGTLSKEELGAFDENKYFSTTLREQSPHLYGVETRPASTSPGATTPAAAPATASANSNPGDPPQERDARKLDNSAYRARLIELGLTPPSAGMPN